MKQFRCILADPPWNERGGGKIKRGADRHYKTQKTWKIIEIMIRAPVWNPHDDSLLWMWATNNFLEDGFFVMKALGFRYVTNFVWAKDRYGTGQRSRGQHELMLLGVRGRVPVPEPEKRQSTLIGGKVLPREPEHSRKPEEAHELIEKCCRGPRVEMFARQPRRGWTVWGDEV